MAMDIISRQAAAMPRRPTTPPLRQVTLTPRRQVMTMAAPADIRPITAAMYTFEVTTGKTAHTLPRTQGAPHIGADNGYNTKP